VLPQDRDDPVLEVSHACVHRHKIQQPVSDFD
jgi:hypothetical protein